MRRVKLVGLAIGLYGLLLLALLVFWHVYDAVRGIFL